MPTYEYHCTNCGFEFEQFQSMAAEPLSVCPKCKGRVQRKISGGTGLIFKGSGFYITDYKNKHTDSDTSTTKTKPKSNESKKPKKPED
jgi:putative FmdB family regulatory protein